LTENNKGLGSKLQIDNNFMFLFAVAVLVIILVAGSIRDNLQYNLMFLIALSLSCSIVFAFLPFSAEVGIEGWLKAGGTAAIFAVCLWQTVPFAKEMLKSDHDRQQKIFDRSLADDELKAKNSLLADKERQLGELRAAVARLKAEQPGGSALSEVSKQNFQSMRSALGKIKESLSRSQEFARAARDNYSDSKTCSLRASQALENLSQLSAQFDSAWSALNNVQAAIK
jgi:hypothetical protein